MTNPIQTQFVNMLASTILGQDYVQMRKQYPDNELKRAILFEHVFPNEEAVIWVKDMLCDYKYPDFKVCVDLYESNKNIQ